MSGQDDGPRPGELAHWGYGAVGGVTYGALPHHLVYGLVLSETRSRPRE